ncbi:MAG: MiaB/RimO family radical SAM methylthiotransferase [Actinobacteria bacterium]|nr:MiaB/RimO family radical SAM methylthiotransferase [Actinomycetota bacterium]MCG2819386.1 MiaB/RimO family radical SAM methylthiotransferase [Actinomycetes bacterium]MBU4219090.1 MiaB/RimO family radical SAM methylthiotransferase [Actinomycetota bacterium]MBU4358377.1 MiaB/RimO family radical SAM methylthiotransferase [Actinomycetota bacterium]MBU4390921.1 MiaB/RimO family radical SAM methylthiotransferase [Actinomycetota bacterium]
MKERTYRVITLGCRVNRSDSLEIEKELSRRSFERSPPGEPPDLWVVNTCAVTVEGMRKSRKAVRKCLRAGGEVVVTGCAVAFDPGAFEEMGVSVLVGNEQKGSLAGIACGPALGPDPVAPGQPELTRVPIKVQDGCRRYCTYCIVPYLRGRPYCRDVESVVADVRYYRDAGAGEVILCGIDLGSYRDPSTKEGLELLALKAAEEAGDMWVRLSSLDLTDVSERLISMLGEGENLCGHLHIPLQSADRGVLGDMGRGYGPEEFRRKVDEIRRKVPDVIVTTDVMVGFPTEDERAFENTRSFLEEMSFSRVHVFRYSPRPGTAAFSLGDPVGPTEKRERATELRRIARETAKRFHESLIGRIIAVLIEAEMETEPGMVFGRTQGFAGIIAPGDGGMVGRKVLMRVTSAGPRWIRGEP